MSKNILFIGEQGLKDRSVLSGNVDPKQIRPTIKAVQDIYIHPLLGSALFTRLQQDIDRGTVSGPYKILLDEYLLDCIVWYVMAKITTPLQYKYTNKGTIKRTTEEGQQIDYAEMNRVAAEYLNTADFYAQRAIQFLCANSTDYPEYKAPGGRADDIKPDRTTYHTGIFLGTS
ncbi:hypothetical protein KTO58_01275 [Chitinophaga pendula]|uniref:DUF6712 family protein n=1 Tax=Chitinophaga TaxID=79328 RepID=UPI000BB07797|nr:MULTISPECIES: hypothetical protein [Chitinophaga]ASZ14505.1 hypothetical protein CK934_27940 [Chitinophaga sp. MD30]UCJ07837.1 hypothetical protein KTO58_01275 [Chitinophaga pendula]